MRNVPCCLGIWLVSNLFAGPLSGAAPDDESTPALVDVFVGGQEGYHTYRIPALIVSPDQTLLAFCEGRKSGPRDHGDIDMVLKRSTDGGKTWGPLEVVYEDGGDAAVTIGNPCPVVDQTTGVVWLPFTRNNDRVFVTSSSDNGKSWTTPREITAAVKKPDWSWYATGPVNGIQLTQGKHRGRLVIPSDHRVKNQGDWNQAGHSHMIYSDDHGKTWKLGEATEGGMNECTVAELADGTLLLNMRSYRGKNKRATATSTDGGITWSDCVDNDTLIEPVCQGSMLRITWPGEGSKSTLLFANPATTKGRHHLTVRTSYDEGRTWPAKRLLYEGSSAYSCLTALPNGNAGILFERDGSTKISFAPLNSQWLTENALPQ